MLELFVDVSLTNPSISPIPSFEPALFRETENTSPVTFPFVAMSRESGMACRYRTAMVPLSVTLPADEISLIHYLKKKMEKTHRKRERESEKKNERQR